MQRGKTLVRVVTGLLSAGALVGIAAPASADPSVTVGAATQQPPAVRTVGQASVAALSWSTSCFGYTGTFGSGTRVLAVDWTVNGSTDECFGIAPNRTIWHAWPNSGGWKVMPHGGLADDMYGADLNSAGQHVIKVSVYGIGIYCSTLTSSWQPWVRC